MTYTPEAIDLVNMEECEMYASERLLISYHKVITYSQNSILKLDKLLYSDQEKMFLMKILISIENWSIEYNQATYSR